MMSGTGPPEAKSFQSSCTQESQGASQGVFPLVESKTKPTLALRYTGGFAWWSQVGSS